MAEFWFINVFNGDSAATLEDRELESDLTFCIFYFMVT